MAAAPDSSTSDEDEACYSYTEEMPSCQEGDLREALLEV